MWVLHVAWILLLDLFVPFGAIINLLYSETTHKMCTIINTMIFATNRSGPIVFQI